MLSKVELTPRIDGEGSIQRTPEGRRRRRELWIICFLVLLIVILTFLETRLSELHYRLPVTDNVLFFCIVNINVILMLLLVFLIVRNVVKLVFERKRRVLGSKLRTKLVAAFVVLSLVPTGLLFSVAWFFITRSIEMWVHAHVENALGRSLEVSQHYYRNASENAVYFATQLSHAIDKEKLLDPGCMEGLRQFVQIKQLEYNLDRVALYAPDMRELVSAHSALFRGKETSPFDHSVLPDILKGKNATRIREVEHGELVEGVVPVPESSDPGKIRAILVVDYFVPESIVNKMAEISQSLDRHRQMILYKKPFKSGMLMALIMVTLLIVFAATWLGFYLAKGITVPLQHVASGIGQVASGNLDYQIDAASDDEMGILVESFNRMTEDLKNKGREIQEAQDRLSRTNLELEQRRRYMEIVLRNVGAGVVSVDGNGVIKTINTFAEDLFQVQAKDLLGKSYAELLSGEHVHLLIDMIQEMNQKGLKSLERPIQVQIKGDPKSLRVRLTMLEDEKGAFLGLVGVFEDHTELIKAQRAAAWREVARRIAHEIKNPLTPIQLSAQRLKKRYSGTLKEDGNVFEECTNTIIRQVLEMKNLVSEFSNFARMPAANPVPQNLNRIVREMLVLYEEAHRPVVFEFEEEPALPLAYLDEDQIRRVLMNLLDNAISATGQHGRINLRTRHDRFLNMAVLEIADEGPGIPAEIRGRLFEPYTSTKQGGTGLGLAIVKTIISDHKGYIRVRNNYPRGTRFILEFPVQT